METINLTQVCGGSEGRPMLGISASGDLWRLDRSGQWEEFKFNELYSGYYPHCIFTAIACFESGFIAAGLGVDGLPLVFTSLLGGVWDQTNLMGKTLVSGYTRATGRINIILYDNISKQVFLLCDNGELVTLPDCPKCVRIKKIADVGIITGNIDGDHLKLTLKNGETIRFPVQEAVQYRISISYAKRRIAKGGYLVDLRSEDRCRLEGGLEGALRISTDDVYDWLTGISKESFLAFICSYGVNADEAVRYARLKGYNNTYSLGGIKKLFHEE